MSLVNMTPEQTALKIGSNTQTAEQNLMEAYSLKDDSPDKLKELASKLGITVDANTTLTARSIQLVAEQRFQNATQVFSLFSNLMDKIDQMKQRVISKMSN